MRKTKETHVPVHPVSVPERARKVAALLAKAFPEVKTPLDHGSVWELMVAVQLSAQCTDARVNMVTPAVFQRYPRLEDYAAVDPVIFAQDIRSVTYPNQKARHIVACAQLVLRQHGGKVPDTMAELLTLPGVARKTANAILSSAYGKNEGFVVDTHILRLSRLLGFSKEKTPEKVEKDMMALFPQQEWRNVSLRLVFHGRKTCIANRPKCEVCPLNRLCPSSTLPLRRERAG